MVALSFCGLRENALEMHISPPTQNCPFHFLIEISIGFDLVSNNRMNVEYEKPLPFKYISRKILQL